MATNNYYGKWSAGYSSLRETWIKTAEILINIFDDEISYKILQGQIYNAFFNYKKAIEKYDEALLLNKDSLMEYDLFGYKAQSYKLKKDYPESGYYFNRAILGYDKLLKKYPNDESIMVRKALNLAQIYKKGEAILVFEKILKINPNNLDAIKGIENIYNF